MAARLPPLDQGEALLDESKTYSFDVKWTKEFHMSPLPLRFVKQHVFRTGFAVFDITDRVNPLGVYNNNAPTLLLVILLAFNIATSQPILTW